MFKICTVCGYENLNRTYCPGACTIEAHRREAIKYQATHREQIKAKATAHRVLKTHYSYGTTTLCRKYDRSPILKRTRTLSEVDCKYCIAGMCD
jgi:hypothetical protein